MFSIFNKKEKEEEQNKLTSPRRKPLSEIFYEEKAVKLPSDFAEGIMDLEMQLEFPESYNIEVVMKLNELYRMAIEHYVNEDSRKASHFQKKLTTLLTNPQTLELMDQKIAENKISEKVKSEAKQPESPETAEEIQNKKAAIKLNTSLRKELNQFNCQSDIVVRSILDGAEKKNQLTGQEEILKVRLERRSRSKKEHKKY